MKTDNPTTVRLSESMQKIKDKVSPIYGLKNVLEAGLLMFSRLSSVEREKIIAEVHAQEIVSAASAEAAAEVQKRRKRPRPSKSA